MDRFVFLTLDGLARGAVYAAFSLALVLIWRGTRVVNFAQGAMAAATAFIALALIHSGQSYWVALVVALVSGFALGALVERLVVRRVEGGPELNAVIVTLGLFVAIEAIQAHATVDFAKLPLDLSLVLMTAMLAVSLTLASFSYRFVEVVGRRWLRERLGVRQQAARILPAESRTA